jgi:hypothetical protein
MNYIEKELTRIYNAMDSKYSGVFNSPLNEGQNLTTEGSLGSCKDSIDAVKKQVITTMAKHLTDTPVLDLEWFVNPSYYRSRDIDFRGYGEQITKELLSETDDGECFIGHTLGAYDEYMQWDYEHFIQYIPQHNKEFGLDIEFLVPVTDSTYDAVLEIDEDKLRWNNTDIMTESDWNKLQEYMDANDISMNEYSGLVWHEADNHIEVILNIMEEIDQQIFYALYDILDYVESSMECCELRGQAIGFIIDDIIVRGKGDWDDRFKLALEKAQDFYYNLSDKVDEETA